MKCGDFGARTFRKIPKNINQKANSKWDEPKMDDFYEVKRSVLRMYTEMACRTNLLIQYGNFLSTYKRICKRIELGNVS